MKATATVTCKSLHIRFQVSFHTGVSAKVYVNAQIHTQPFGQINFQWTQFHFLMQLYLQYKELCMCLLSIDRAKGVCAY
ncbi:hypothetical protein L1987_20875 [Smallanthus sonchifolius]|uniref:Uncharacterized protein n=1 Tax=Smallanthus sonchifolius TaxID=185202 RepID=A0ACB9IUI4_9ASTR|nr:hypothetical protein L1987_20875 [Smallanthus sonchifolius]